ncbi:MAG: hypothetical protein ACE37J_11815 [Pikeienuella sp.]|uniref:hypothetical protein n=1 Tax=Pikeienuella sp. TaxID=2831957 RepID=UPI00391BEA5D
MVTQPKTPSPKRPINDAWEKFRLMVIPDKASAVQIAEMQKAFYAGAAIHRSLLINGVSDEDEPTEADMALMERIDAELRESGLSFDIEMAQRLTSSLPPRS